MHPSIVNATLYHPIYEDNEATSMLIDTTKIHLTTGATVCPNYQITIINDDGSELNSNVFTFDQTSSEFRIDTRDVSLSGTYQLKIVVSFDSSLYQ